MNRHLVHLAIVLVVVQFWSGLPLRLVETPVQAATTTGGVNWLDPLGYTKPFFVPINVPDESTATKYWVVLSGGSGTTCSEASPCAPSGANGKTGVNNDGGAYVYIKDTGGLSMTWNGTGDADCRTQSCNTWVVVKPWPAGSTGCASECLATIQGTNNLNNDAMDHIIFDGGPNLNIKFVNNSGNNNAYVVVSQTSYVVVYRTQTTCDGTPQGETGWAIGGNDEGNHYWFINNEGYDCFTDAFQTSWVYFGPGSSGEANDIVIQNNVIRNWAGECIEYNPRVDSDNFTVIGNAIHDCGKGTCPIGFDCRGALTILHQNGGDNGGVIIANNLMWDFGAACTSVRASGSPAPLQFNNVCWDYFNEGTGGADGDSYGLEGGANSCPQGIARNNIVVEPDSAENPMCTGVSTNRNFNMVESGEPCGGDCQTYSGSVFLSTDEDNVNFLKLASGSVAIDTGTTTGAPSVYSPDYCETTRPQGASPDIGAFEGFDLCSGGGGVTPTPIFRLRVRALLEWLLPPSQVFGIRGVN